MRDTGRLGSASRSSTGPAEPDGLVPLGDTGWHAWRSAVLRAPGFPATGLDLLAAPECAKEADAFLATGADRAPFDVAFTAATRRMTARLHGIAADPLFCEAVTWQSLNAVEALDGLLRAGPDANRNSRHRPREILVTRYWQRYCAKNDTIGFFGPVCWASLTADDFTARVEAGPDLVRARVVDLERRVLAAYADRLAADPRFRPWLPVTRQPQLALRGDDLLQAGLPARRLSPAHAVLLGACDGVRSAQEVAALALAEPRTGLRSTSDALLALEQLAEQDLLRWGVELPLTVLAESELERRLVAIAEPALRDEALSGLARLLAARDVLADAAGDADAVRAALLRLQDEFVAVTGGDVLHRPGATYAGRGLAYEETLRDLDVAFGEPLLSMLADTLVPLLEAARWLTAAMAGAFTEALRELYDDAAADGPVMLGDLFDAALGVLFGQGPVAGVLADFTTRWSQLLGLTAAADGPITLDPAEVRAAVARLFGAAAPGWTAARLHSPDLHLCAPNAQALADGEFTLVLGELHVSWLTNDSGTLTRFHPDPGALRAALHRDLGDRTLLLYPADFPEFTARIAFTLDGPGDVRLAYTPAPVPDLGQVLPLAAVTVSLVDGELTGHAPDGRSWPLLELFGPFLSSRAVNAFKVAADGAYTPRVSIGRLVVHRQTWRTTVADCARAADLPDEAARYLAVRRWRDRLGLPEQVFVRVGTEVKPVYVDFTSPAYVAAFVAMVRAASRAGGAGVPLTVSEMLPGPEQAWVPDAAGRRYFSELRMAIRDPATAPTRS
ncbi:lantibiotic dehydratase [Catellatospora coxensis]|uniref:Lantibiotic dehydratase n=1 Tax=Catellatospora coxensis TaxID=310354 RepID=A0A8J3P4S9_9ACTN|nr:lantibiotic dehydratase [Catellatospora coxensis]GIG04143.1 lantibiotic dehydratase [Catellatospora coxensis]